MNLRHHIRYPVRNLEHKYPNEEPVVIMRRYFYTYVHALCAKKHISLRKESKRLGWNSTYLACVLTTSGREDKLTEIATCVTKELSPTLLQIKRANTFTSAILPHLFNNIKWHDTVKQALFWQSLRPLNPIGRAIKRSGLSLNNIAKRRHVHYATIYVSLNASRVSWTTLFETAYILHLSPIKLASQFHPELTQSKFLAYLNNGLENYLRRLAPRQLIHHFNSIKLILKTYLQLCRSVTSALSMVCRFYLPLKYTLLQGLRMVPRFKHLEKDSPAYTFIKVLRDSHAYEHKGALGTRELSYNKIQKVLDLQDADESIPLNTARYIERHFNIGRPIFKHTNNFYDLRYQHIYHKYQNKMKIMGLDIKKCNGSKLMYFRCTQGIKLKELASVMGVCKSRVRQFTFAEHFPLYRILAAYPQAKKYFLPQRVAE